jgi:hypothetical protein
LRARIEGKLVSRQEELDFVLKRFKPLKGPERKRSAHATKKSRGLAPEKAPAS